MTISRGIFFGYVPRPTAFAILVRTYILKHSAIKAKLVTLRATAAMVGPLFGVPSGVLYAQAIDPYVSF